MKRLPAAIFITGLVAGTLDITAACTQFYIRTGKSPVIVLNYVASALVGKDAFSGGALMSSIGLLMHYFIAFGWTILFYFLYPRVSFLRKNKIVVGLSYGMFVWAMMNLVLVPMTLIPSAPFNFAGALQACGILMICIGLPISILANRHFHTSAFV